MSRQRRRARDAPAEKKRRRDVGLGPLLCWAVVFADIGTSVYYTPGILFNQVGGHAALFVGLTLVVFVLLTFKYAEVAIRYPEGGGVVTVGAHAVNPLVGLIGGLFILVDYFLTASLSALSGVIYVTVIAPGLQPVVIVLTAAALMLLAVLNLTGIRADAKVTMVIAVIALGSQLAVIVAVIAHVGVVEAVGAIPKVFSGPGISGVGLLTGYAGAFLAFSGLESITQLAPAMATPQSRVAPRAMLMVVITVALTSPLLTLWSTTMLTQHNDPNQFISALGGFAAGPVLQFEVAASAALLLIFASNTAIIGSYHVFLALSKLRFLPAVLLRCNRRRGTPHWAILIATVVPLGVVVLSRGDVGLLGDMYAFGLLGAFSVTCVCLDIVRWRERRAIRARVNVGADRRLGTSTPGFVVGILTSALVVTAWVTNLFAKPLATFFGGVVTLVGLGVAALTHELRRRRGHPGVVPAVERLEHLTRLYQGAPPGRRPVLVLLEGQRDELEALGRAGVETADGRPLVFAYVGVVATENRRARILEILDPYLVDESAQAALREAHRASRPHRQRRHLVYAPRRDRSTVTAELYGSVHPHEVVVLRRDEAALARLSGGRRSHIASEGVALTRYQPAEPRGQDPPRRR